MESLNLLVTLNQGYLEQLIVLLRSILDSNPNVHFDVYILHKSLSEKDLDGLKTTVGNPRLSFFPIEMDDELLLEAPTSKRYPKEMYYRLFASLYLPKALERILYLDPDIVVINPLNDLYHMPMEKHYFVACSHILIQGLQRFNELRLNMEKNTPYINSGVLPMNLQMLRKHLCPEEVYEYIRKHKQVLVLPDQDVLSALYGKKTLLVDSLLYNLTEKYVRAYNFRLLPGEFKINLDWIRKNAVIIHYCGKNKPWKGNYLGTMNVFYDEIAQRIAK